MTRYLPLLLALAGCSESGLSEPIDPLDGPDDADSGLATDTGGTELTNGGSYERPEESDTDTDTDTDADSDSDSDTDTDADTDTDTDTDADSDTDTDADTDPPPDLVGGHIDVDTSSFIAEIGSGTTDAHDHQYDDSYRVTGVDFFNFLDGALHEIHEDVAQDQRFKLIIINGDLNPGGRLSVNKLYLAPRPLTWQSAAVYDDTPVSDLRVYSLGGVAGSTQLTMLSMNFDAYAIYNRELLPTQTGCVRSNDLGPNGEWRNGALTIQAVAVDANGDDAFTLDYAMSGGGHGPATSGLLWESTIFWHWTGPCYHEDGWDTYVP